MINVMTVKSKIAETGLDVQVDTLTITVSEGTVAVQGVSGDVPGVEHVVTPDPDHRTSVTGYLVQDTDDLSLDVLVDEYAPGAGETRYAFPADGPYKLLDRLFHVSVPAGATTLEDLDISVWKIEKVEAAESRIDRLLVKEQEEDPPDRDEDEDEVDLLLDPGAQALLPDGGE